MVAPSEQMFSAFILSGKVLPFVPRAHPHTRLPHEAALPGWRVRVQLPEHHGIRLLARAQVRGWGPVPHKAAGVAHPAAPVRGLLRVCRGQTFGLGLRLGPGRALTGSPDAPETLFSPTHHPAPHQADSPQWQPQNANTNTKLGMGPQRGGRAGPALVKLPV